MRAPRPPKGKDFFGGEEKKQQRKTQTDNGKDMASITSSGWVERVGGGGLRLQLDVAKRKSVSLNTKLQ